jgi:PAS domain S-box-containing protein
MSNLSFEIDPLHYLIAFGGFMLAIYRLFLKPKVERFSKAIDNIEKIPDIIVTLDKVKYQVFPNGQSSMFDGMTRIETRIVTVEQKQDIFLNDYRHGVFETDSSGKWINVNRTLCRTLICTEIDLLGKGWMNFFEKEGIERLNHAMSNEIELKMVCNMKRTDGGVISVMITANPLRSNVNKSLIGYLGTIDETI